MKRYAPLSLVTRPWRNVSLASLVTTTKLVVAVLTLASCSGKPDEPPPPPDPTRVHVTGGQVQGAVEEDLIVFKGIPFAAPPVGENRWRETQPVVAWDGVRPVTEFATPCPQKGLLGPTGSEDCLYLNVWRPQNIDGGSLPVMVWVHGGSFMGGSSRDGNSAALARRGVVVVSIAYRLNVFGFLAHPELSAESGHGSGNFGLQDQIAALRWVKDNIAPFGGDPHNVTVFGGSAGAHSVSMLAASPLARGLYDRVIAQSGGSFAPIRKSRAEGFQWMGRLSDGEREGVETIASLGVDSIAAARALPPDKVLSALGDFWPVVDNHVIVGDQYKLYQQGLYHDTPALIGSTADEGYVFVLGATPESFNQTVAGLGGHDEAILAAYPHSTNDEKKKALGDMLRDALFAWQTWTWARLQSAHSGASPVYAYYFDYRDAWYPFPGMRGPYHAADFQYVFGGPPEPTTDDQRVTELMMSYWVNFARTGNPNGPGLPEWPHFRPDDQRMMYLNARAQAGTVPNQPQLEAMDDYFAWRRAQE